MIITTTEEISISAQLLLRLLPDSFPVSSSQMLRKEWVGLDGGKKKQNNWNTTTFFAPPLPEEVEAMLRILSFLFLI
jgi:hypothetical protein